MSSLLLNRQAAIWADSRLTSRRRQRRGRWIGSSLATSTQLERNRVLHQKLPVIHNPLHHLQAKPLPVPLRLWSSSNRALLARLQLDPTGTEAQAFRRQLRRATTRQQYENLLTTYRIA